MRPRSSLGFFLVLAALVVGGGIGLALQWRQSITLRVELERSRFRAEEMAHLRSENQRLREKQIPAVELERLRADHAALPRLRAEIEALNKPSPVKGP
jgi:hypothetical protein